MSIFSLTTSIPLLKKELSAKEKINFNLLDVFTPLINCAENSRNSINKDFNSRGFFGSS
jgi:hypothetical protein